MKITKKALLKAGYTEFAGRTQDDPCCVGYFQKKLAKSMIDVSFWRFTLEPKGVQQVNFQSYVPFGPCHLDVGLRGVPETWTVEDLETYFRTVCLLGGCTNTLLRVNKKTPKKRVK